MQQNFLDMPLIAVVVIPLILLFVSVLLTRWLSKRDMHNLKNDLLAALAYVVSHLDGGKRIQASNGIPTLRQLTPGIGMDAKLRGLAQGMYNLGLEQFNHDVNNRDGIIAEARDKMNELSNRLSQAEISLAQEVGIALATDVDDGVLEAQVRFQDLGPEAQIYAQSKRREYESLQKIARDLECDVPRTDFTSVKSRIASGEVSLDSIKSELPIMWQEIMTLNERVEPVPSTGKPPKRVNVPVMFLTKDKGVLVDKKAERDGKWMKSHKHGMIVPYQEPVTEYEFVRADRPPVPIGKRIVVIDRDPSTEWETELWRQGGYFDQQFLLYRHGQAPEQLRKVYWARLIRNVGRILAVILGAIIIMMLVQQYIG